ncbi:hypothetical protein VNO77_22166 [Canavalia gladiata]|uniref:Uncharacterized protein n=1 Tax=Canavalia gladiata TaxID=3824 RepID=A0AAN9Q7S4_CANGL
MEADSMDHAHECNKCQWQADLYNTPLEELSLRALPYPFRLWDTFSFPISAVSLHYLPSLITFYGNIVLNNETVEMVGRRRGRFQSTVHLSLVESIKLDKIKLDGLVQLKTLSGCTAFPWLLTSGLCLTGQFSTPVDVFLLHVCKICAEQAHCV